MLDLLTDEILANREWKNVKEYDVNCSKLFKEAFSTALINNAIKTGILLNVSEKELKKATFNSLQTPHGFLLNFKVIDNITGYSIAPKLKDE